MEPENRYGKPFLDRIGVKYPNSGGYFSSQGIGFCGLENIPPCEFKKQRHEYGFRSSDSKSMQTETGFDTRKGSFDTGPFGIYGTKRGGLFLLRRSALRR